MPYPRIFVSYKRDHDASKTLLHKLRHDLQDYEVLFDEDTPLGNRWDQKLYDWVLGCDAAIVLVSKEATASDWCRREWAVLAARWSVAKLKVIPVFVDGRVATGILDAIQGSFVNEDLDALIVQIQNALADVTASSGMTVQDCLAAQDYLAAHQGWLQYQFNDAPVFNREPYALSDVYIEPQCGVLKWQQIQDDKVDPFTDSDECGGRQSLLDTVLGLMGDPTFSDFITIQAGPGAGKSAFTLRLANELVDKGLHPILIKFRDLRLNSFDRVDELLDDAIRIGASDEASPNIKTEIIGTFLDDSIKFKQADISKAVIILDGWDEVSLTGNESFKAQLSTWLPKIHDYFVRKRGAKVRVILTGRPSAEVSHSGVLKKTTPVLTLRHITPEQLTSYANNISEKLAQAQAAQHPLVSWQLGLNTLAPILEHYKQWFEKDDGDSNVSTGDILGNPLLAYLAFVVFSQSNVAASELLEQPSKLYHELVNITVANAGKGMDEKLEAAAHRGGEKLRRLLHEVAATISLFRAESVSYDELEMRFQDHELPVPNALLQNWSEQTDTGSALQELLINFYFKGGNRHLGCEFLHKSFREYLYAEAIFYSLKDAAECQQGQFKATRNYEYWQDFVESSPEYQLSRRLSYLLSPQWLSEEVRDHLFWLIEQDIEKTETNWLWLRDALLEVYAWWAEGVLIRHQPKRRGRQNTWQAPYINQLFEQVMPFDEHNIPPIRTAVLDAHLGAALMQLTAFVFANLDPSGNNSAHIQGRAKDFVMLHEEELRFNPGGKGFFKALAAKFDTEGWKQRPGLGRLVLNKIALSEQDVRYLNASHCQLQDIVASSVVFETANFDFSNLHNAYLVEAKLQLCFFYSANLTGANLAGAYLGEADLQQARLNNANLIGARLHYADLTEAHLTEAELSGADLTNANLTIANLTNANLTEVDLTNANLTGANLTNANLTDADLTDADLTGSDLTNANLTNAKLINANLTNANLTGAKFDGAILDGAIMDGVKGYTPPK